MKKRRTSKTETCIMCGCDTGIPEDQHIDHRRHYVEGTGQLCEKCDTEINARYA